MSEIVRVRNPQIAVHEFEHGQTSGDPASSPDSIAYDDDHIQEGLDTLDLQIFLLAVSRKLSHTMLGIL